jgi:hypothetical protein
MGKVFFKHKIEVRFDFVHQFILLFIDPVEFVYLRYRNVES